MNSAIIFVVLFIAIRTTQAMCPPGSFIDKKGVCKPCPRDTYNSKKNAKSCTDCPRRKHTIGTGTRSVHECYACVPGMAFDHGSCLSCDSGTFNPLPNQRRCRKCRKGTFSNTYNPVFCSPCRAGRVSDTKNTIVCTLCTGTTYSPLLGRQRCISCPRGTRTNPDGASCRPRCDVNKPTCKACPPGTQMTKNRGCIPCPVGTVNKYHSVTRCYPCSDAHTPPFQSPIYLVPNEGRTECVCPSGFSLGFEYFGPQELNPFCGPCPDGMASDGIKCNK